MVIVEQAVELCVESKSYIQRWTGEEKARSNLQFNIAVMLRGFLKLSFNVICWGSL